MSSLNNNSSVVHCALTASIHPVISLLASNTGLGSLPSGSYSNPLLTWLEAEDHESSRNANQAYYYEYIQIFSSKVAIQRSFSLKATSCIQTLYN